MPIEIQVMREGHVILQIFTDKLTTQEVVDNVQRVNAILDDSKWLVHTITDTRAITKMPQGFLATGKNLLRDAHPMSGYNMIVSSNHFFSTITDLFIRLLPQYHIKICKTIEEAWAEIDRVLAVEALPESKTS